MLKIIKERTPETIKEYYINFWYKDDPEAGFCFPATRSGEPDFSSMTPEALANYEACLTDERLTEAEFEVRDWTYNKYYEPFLGGGAVLLDLCPEEAIVNDINPELINMYLQVRDNVEAVIGYLSRLDAEHETVQDAKAFYYRIREDYNLSRGYNTYSQAARFIYLNKHCFNGLYRVNSKGEFNVPFNGKLTGGSFNADHLRAVSKQIQNVEFLCGDFEKAVRTIAPKDFLFIDSPYAPLTPTSFVDYTKEGFSYEDHKRLADFYMELSDYGVYCMLTNHDTELIRDLYRGFNFTEVDVRRSINRNGDNRKGKEVIITNY